MNSGPSIVLGPYINFKGRAVYGVVRGYQRSAGTCILELGLKTGEAAGFVVFPSQLEC